MIAIFITFLITQRIIELMIARRNERKMKQMGAIEAGEEHYYLFIVLHVAFFLSLIIETVFTQAILTTGGAFLLWGIFIATQIFRIWCMQSLGMYWNTKIIVLPHSQRVRKGPYRFMKHPNYIVVAIELSVIPLLVQAYITAIIFPLLHLLLLCIRIPTENSALRQLEQ